MTPFERYQQIVLNSLNNTNLQTPTEANAYTCGFADGVSWLSKRCIEIGVLTPADIDLDLFLTEETK